MQNAAAVLQWREKAKTLSLHDRPYIDGQFTNSTSEERFGTLNPATGDTIRELPKGSQQDVDLAVRAARRAFADGRWHRLPIGDRKAILLRVADLIEARRDEFALIEALEVGKAISNARSEISMSIDWFRFYAEAIDKVYGQVAPSDGMLIAYSVSEPRGVVGAIVPWNFPLANAAMKLAPALAAGNTIVLKPSEIATLSSLTLAALMTEAGLPAGVVNVVPGLGGTVGEALARHPDVDFLTFTGSTGTGHFLMKCAGESNGKPLMLECGGKSPQIIRADMLDEIEAIGARIARDAFWNQGQWCSARTRLIIEADIYEQVLEAVTTAAAAMVPGDPLDPTATYGTISAESQFQRILSYINVAQREGARSLLQGATAAPCLLSMAPSVFADVTPDMTIAREEIFGPVLACMRARDFGEAIAMANDTSYGLSATVWTHDGRSVIEAARELRAGRVAIRTSTSGTGSSGVSLGAEPSGASGFGIEKGVDGLRAYCRTRAIEIF